MEKEVNVSVKYAEKIKKYLDIETSLRFIVYGATIGVVSIFIILAILTSFNVIGGFGTPTDFVTFAILGGTGIYGGYTILRNRRIMKIEERFPDFIRDLAESKRAGMTFTKAILLASKGSYGALTSEIRKMAHQLSWGQTVNDAFLAFAKRVNTPLIKRIVSLIVEASKGGGSTADVLEAAARDAAEVKFLQSERKANMSSYIIIVYIGTLCFLAIIAILSVEFLPNMTGSATTLPGIVKGMGVKLGELKKVLFYGALVQSFGSGLVAGVFERGRLQAGAKHACVLVFVTWLVFKLLIGGI